MFLKWLGHACFYLEYSKVRFVLDPYKEGMGYPDLDTIADIVTISHNHFDHNNHQVIKGNPRVLTGPEKVLVNGITCYGIPVYHDMTQGSQRGNNIIFVLEGEGLKIAHCGDLGHPLPVDVVEILYGLDILLIPVGGVYTIGSETAFQIIEAVQPKITVPMHYKTDYVKLNIEQVDNFLKYFDSNKVKYLNQLEFSITSDYLKNISDEIWVLSY